jgi:hypothetical protein
MLYLGGSVYVCWEELARPPFHEIQVAAFALKPGMQVKILDFGHHAHWLTGDVALPAKADYLAANIACWPIIAACSVNTPHRGSEFIPEYIIPQMILQWIRTRRDLSGIRYFSTQPDLGFDLPGPVCNYVFPPRTTPTQGFCQELRNMFIMTDPVAWQILEAVNVEIVSHTQNYTTDWSPYPGAERMYGLSRFGDIERKMDRVLRETILREGYTFGQP